MFNLEFADETVARKCYDEFIVKDMKFTMVMRQDDQEPMDVCYIFLIFLNILK